jgi:predicted Zn-dependent protease
VKAARVWTDPLAVNTVGRYLLWQGQPQMAADLIAAVQPAVRATNASISARASAALGQSASAQQSANAILATAPDDVDALLLHAQFEQKAGHANIALEAAQNAVSADPLDPETYVVLADLNRLNGQAWRARQVFEDGLKQLPQDFLLAEKYTQFLHESGDKGRAISVALSLARALPSSVKAWSIYLAQCQWSADAACIAEAEKGRQSAQSVYRNDPPPGVRTDRGLLGEF